MILNYTELKKTAGGNNPAEVVANLVHMKIKFLLRPDGKPVSTIDAVNAAMKQRPVKQTQTDSHQDIEI